MVRRVVISAFPEPHQREQRGSAACKRALSGLHVLHRCLCEARPAHRQGEMIKRSFFHKVFLPMYNTADYITVPWRHVGKKQ